MAPLSVPSPSNQNPPATVLVIFGASGDLTVRKLIPALYNLFADTYLPEHFIVIGSARTKFTDEEFRTKLYEGLKKFSRRPVSDEQWAAFSSKIFYQPVDGSVFDDFKELKARIESLTEGSITYNYLHYLAVSPEFFAGIAANLKHADLMVDPATATRRTGLIVEKPFGHDVPSARQLNQELMEHLRESQIFRIDHYLGKETVQNILVFRFANGIFEPLWNNRYIDSIQISVCEEIGVGNRGPYFDQNGITRDIIQNHALQMLSLLCIEPPHSLTDPNAIRDEKVKVLRSMKRHTPQEAAAHSVRGQYVAGTVQGEAVCGYKEEKGISSTSKTETYSALLLEIDNWRWKGVPIYVRAGKRLPKRITDITIYFKSAPHSLFRGRHIGALEQNCLTIQVQPKEGMALHINSKPPGLRLSVEPVQMDFQYNQSFGVASSDAYERLLLDAMRGDSTLFTRNDEIEEAWALLEPFFDAWSDKYLCPLHDYVSGTWGPAEGDKLLEQRNHKWRQL